MAKKALKKEALIFFYKGTLHYEKEYPVNKSREKCNCMKFKICATADNGSRAVVTHDILSYLRLAQTMHTNFF